MLKPAQEKHSMSKGWRGCISHDGKTMLILFSNWSLAWLYIYDFKDAQSDELVLRDLNKGARNRGSGGPGESREDPEPILISQRQSINIYFLGQDTSQAVIQSLRGFCIFSTVAMKITFKFNFKDEIFLELTFSKFALAVPRAKNGVIVDMGELPVPNSPATMTG